MKKKIIAVLCSIIMVIPLVLSNPKADNSYTTHTTPTVTSYGQYYSSSSYFEDLVSYELGPAAITIPISNATSFTFVYEFKDTYDGFINLSLTAVNAFAWNTTYFYCDGCTLIQQPNMSNSSKVKTFGLHFNSAKKISFTVIHETSGTGATNADKIFYDYLQGTTTTFSITSSNFNVVPDVADDLHYLRGRWDYYIPGMSQSLSGIEQTLDTIDQSTYNIYSYLGNDLDNYLASMNSNIQTMTADIALLKTYLDGVEGYIDTLETKLSTIQSYVSTISTNVLGIFNQGICEYWQIPAFIWAFRQQTISPTSKFTFDQYGRPSVLILPSRYDGIFTQDNSIKVNNHSKFYVVFGSNKQISGPGPTINVLEGNDAYPLYYDFINSFAYVNTTNGSNSYYIYYIEIDNRNNLDMYYEIEFVKNFGSGPNAGFNLTPIYLGYGHNMPENIRSMINLDYDNTYTDLLQQIVNGVGGASYDTSQYDQYEQTIDGLNDNMRDRFNNSETTFQNNINSILTPDQTAGGSNTIFERFHFNAINSVFTGFLSDLFTAAPTLQYVLLFGLLLLVLGVFI